MGLNVAAVAPGASRVREAPLLNTSDKSSVPVPVVVPAKTANAPVRPGAPETSKVNATSARLPGVVPVSDAKDKSRPNSVTPSTTVVKGLKSLRTTTPEPFVVESTVMSENVTAPTLHEKPAASYTPTEAVAHAAAKADDAPRNGDTPKSVPAASAAKARHLRLPISVPLSSFSSSAPSPTTKTTIEMRLLFGAFDDLTLL